MQQKAQILGFLLFLPKKLFNPYPQVHETSNLSLDFLHTSRCEFPKIIYKASTPNFSRS